MESSNNELPQEKQQQDDSWVLLGQALDEYVAAYANSLSRYTTAVGKNHAPMDEQFLQDYLTYRIEKDPAKRLLVGREGKKEILCCEYMTSINHSLTYTTLHLDRCVWCRLDG